MADKLTPWYPGDVKPARPGVFQRRYPVGVFFCRWDGMQWFIGDKSSERAAEDRCESFCQFRPWRGLASNPQAKGA